MLMPEAPLEQVENAEETLPTDTEVQIDTPPSEPKEETSAADKTPTLRETPEFKAEFEKAQSGWDRRNKLLETKLSKSQAEAKAVSDKHEALMAERESDQSLSKIIKKFEESGGDPDSVEELSKALRQANSLVRAAEKKMEEATKKEHEVFMANKAIEYSKQYGIPVEELFDCENEYEMQIKGLEYQIANPAKPTKPEAEKGEPKKKPKVDSLLGAGAGEDLSQLSPRQKIELGLRQKAKV